MILNNTLGIAFIHIPKCAGSSVKDQLRVLDETEGRYERSQPHPVHHRVHRAHLPLWLMEELYPEDFKALERCACFAVLRDPQARFASALAQRIEQFGKRDPFSLNARELQHEIDTVMAFLSANPSSPQLEFCHFIPQIDFVDLRGTRFVSHLYRLEDVPALMRDIGERANRSFVTGVKANQKLDMRFKGLKAPVYAANTLLKSVLPGQAYAGLKTRATALLARKGKGPVWEMLHAPEVRDFVAHHYRADFDLLKTVPIRPKGAGSV